MSQNIRHYFVDEHGDGTLFHAKDDLPDVRMLVFKLLATQNVSFQPVIRDKQTLLAQVQNNNQQSPSYHYTANRLYDDMVKR